MSESGPNRNKKSRHTIKGAPACVNSIFEYMKPHG